MKSALWALATAGAVLMGCSELDAGAVLSSKNQSNVDLTMSWDHKPQADVWTQAVMDALDSHGQNLTALVPGDIATWCPAYEEASLEGRKAFWTGLISALTKHESTYRQTAVGGGGKWYGLVQILPSTARGYGCQARSGAALKDGVANLSCAVRIMNHTVARDGVVSAGMRGVAADWGPFHSRKKRTDMINFTRSQNYCQG
ncbi:MAG: transglycosylase SLT domain-containing protein [Maritimibacter sp.]